MKNNIKLKINFMKKDIFEKIEWFDGGPNDKGTVTGYFFGESEEQLKKKFKITDGVSKPLDYEALTLCMRKINHIFKGKHIGLPGFIGGGLAGGDVSKIREIIKKELKDCKVSIVFLPQNIHQMLEEFR